MIPCFRTLSPAALALLILAFGPPAAAQQVSHVQFPHGQDHATVNGTVRGDEYHDYVLRARAGQTLPAHLIIEGTNGDGTANFNVLPSRSDGEAIFNGSASAGGLQGWRQDRRLHA